MLGTVEQELKDDGVVTVNRQELLRLIDEEARVLGLSGEEALKQIEEGAAGVDYLWTDISLLADLLKHTK